MEGCLIATYKLWIRFWAFKKNTIAIWLNVTYFKLIKNILFLMYIVSFYYLLRQTNIKGFHNFDSLKIKEKSAFIAYISSYNSKHYLKIRWFQLNKTRSRFIKLKSPNLCVNPFRYLILSCKIFIASKMTRKFYRL